MSITKLGWVDTLPQDLKGNVIELIKQNTGAVSVLDDLYLYLQNEFEHKRRKVNPPAETSQSIRMLSDYSIQINRKILDEETIFELPQISFQSPLRKKMNLVLHLHPENGANPILSIVNPSTSEPELSWVQLDKAVKLCVLLPILGMSTQDSKKNIGSLCFWMNDKAIPDPAKNDPIICQVNLDLIKKHLVKTGKIPATAESQMLEATQLDGIKPINEAIIQFLTRQFRLCGLNMINHLPSCEINRNHLRINKDTGIVISARANSINDLVLVEAYKGSKDGSLILINRGESNPSYVGFGFKKPIILFSFEDIISFSISDVSKYTFTVTFEIKNEKKDKPDSLEFSMIDQEYYSAIDDFLKMQNIDNNSFNENLREQPSKADANGQDSQAQALAADQDEDEDEEEDGNYQGGEEEDDDDDDDLALEYDSNAENEHSDRDTQTEDEAEGDSVLQQGAEEDDEVQVVE